MFKMFNSYETLKKAIDRNDVEAVRKLVKKDKSLLEHKDAVGRTPLFLTSKPYMVKALIDAGADVFVQDQYGSNALTYAAHTREFESVKLLAEKMMPRDPLLGAAAFFHAVEYERIDIAMALLDYGLPVHTKDKKGMPALSHAVWSGRMDIVQKLLEKGADINLVDHDGRSPLRLAVIMNRQELVYHFTIVDRSFKLSPEDQKDILRNVANDSVKIATLLLRAGANPHVVDDRGRNILLYFIAGWNADVEFVRMALEKGIAVDDVDPEGNSALMIALMRGKEDVARLLMEKGARLDRKNEDANNLLMLAVKGCCTKIALELIGSGAFDLEMRNDEGETVLKIAEKMKQQEIVKKIRRIKRGDEAMPVSPENKADVWLRTGDDKVAYVEKCPELQREITTIFNFVTREKDKISINVQSKAEALFSQSFDDVPQEQLRAALHEFKSRGGEADEDYVLHGNQAVRKISPLQKAGQ